MRLLAAIGFCAAALEDEFDAADDSGPKPSAASVPAANAAELKSVRNQRAYQRRKRKEAEGEIGMVVPRKDCSPTVSTHGPGAANSSHCSLARFLARLYHRSCAFHRHEQRSEGERCFLLIGSDKQQGSHWRSFCILVAQVHGKACMPVRSVAEAHADESRKKVLRLLTQEIVAHWL